MSIAHPSVKFDIMRSYKMNEKKELAIECKKKAFEEETAELVKEVYDTLRDVIDLVSENSLEFQRQWIDQKIMIIRALDKIVVGDFTVSCLLPLFTSDLGSAEKKDYIKYDQATIKEMVRSLEYILRVNEEEEYDIVDLVNGAKMHQQQITNEIKRLKKAYVRLSSALTLIKCAESNFIYTGCLQLAVEVALEMIPCDTHFRIVKRHDELNRIIEGLEIAEKIKDDHSLIIASLRKIVSTNKTVKYKLNNLTRLSEKTLLYLSLSKDTTSKLKQVKLHKNIIELQDNYSVHISQVKGVLPKINSDICKSNK